jgi:hypothetical protein
MRTVEIQNLAVWQDDLEYGVAQKAEGLRAMLEGENGSHTNLDPANMCVEVYKV